MGRDVFELLLELVDLLPALGTGALVPPLGHLLRDPVVDGLVAELVLEPLLNVVGEPQVKEGPRLKLGPGLGADFFGLVGIPTLSAREGRRMRCPRRAFGPPPLRQTSCCC